MLSPAAKTAPCKTAFNCAISLQDVPTVTPTSLPLTVLIFSSERLVSPEPAISSRVMPLTIPSLADRVTSKVWYSFPFSITALEGLLFCTFNSLVF